MAEEEEIFIIDKVIDSRKAADGKREFLIKWQGYPPSQNSWEPEENLDATDIAEYDSRAATAKPPVPKKRPRGKAPADCEWNEDKGCWEKIELSEFEKQRQAQMAENAALLASLGLGPGSGGGLKDPSGPKRKHTRHVGEVNQELRGSLRERTAKSYTQELHHGVDFRELQSAKAIEKKRLKDEEEREKKRLEQEEKQAKIAEAREKREAERQRIEEERRAR